MNKAEWVDPLLRGLAALGVATVIFVGAYLRFPKKRDDHASSDLGLD
jgi:hypothetical protein